MSRRFIPLLIGSLSLLLSATQVAAQGFTDMAKVSTTPCSTSGFANVKDCYNAELPPEPTIQRSLKRPMRAHWSSGETDSQHTKPFGAPKQSANQSFALPNHRASVDGRLVTVGDRGIAKFSPENLDYGLQTRDDVLRKVMSRHGALLPWTRLNPMPGQSRYASNMFTNNDAVDPYNLDLCSKTGADSNSNPQQCRSRETTSHAWVDGDCYEQTAVWSNRANDSNLGKRNWEIRSIDLLIFVPHGKDVHTKNSDNSGIVVYPRSVATDFNALPPAEDFSYNIVASRHDSHPNQAPNKWSRVDILKEAADEECAGSNSEPWCAFLNDQKSIAPHENYQMPGYGEWDGLTFEQALLEPTTTSDGMVIIIHNVGGIQYSYNTEGACDASGWREFKNLSAAYLDSDVNSSYGFARYPVRDFHGNVIPPHRVVRGGYPWVDRKGDNVFFPAGEPQDAYHVKWAVDWDYTYTDGSNTQSYSFQEGQPVPFHQHNNRNARGIAVVGAWTRGKMTLLDNGLNLTDFKTPAYHAEDATFKLQLFQGESTEFRNTGISLLNSLENQFNHLDAMTPISPFDVVWMMNSSINHTSEVVFDEYLHKDALVVAHMNAPLIERPIDAQGGTVDTAFFDDNGFMPQAVGENFRFSRSPRLQNAATTPTTASLTLRGGAFVPPVAQGGVIGKGVYLDGRNDHILIEDLPVDVDDFYLGLWIDWRGAPTTERVVYSFNENSYLTMSLHAARLVINGVTTGTMNLSGLSSNRYFHLGFSNYASLNRSDVIINGNRVGTFELALPTQDSAAYPDAPNGPSTFLNCSGRQTGWHCSDSHEAMAVLCAGNMAITTSWCGNQNMACAGSPGEFLNTTSGNVCTTDTSSPSDRVITVGMSAANLESLSPMSAWIDELRVYRLRASERFSGHRREYMCNLALGSMRENVPKVRELIKASSRNVFASKKGTPVQVSYPRRCDQINVWAARSAGADGLDESLDFPLAAYQQNRCGNSVHRNFNENCKRAQMLGISNKPVVADEPRPDFETTGFCLTCHVSNTDPIEGLRLDVLAAGVEPSRIDARRQPMDWPRVMSGHQSLIDGASVLEQHTGDSIPAAAQYHLDDYIRPTAVVRRIEPID